MKMQIISVAALLAVVALAPRAHAADVPAGNGVLDGNVNVGSAWTQKLGLKPDQTARFIAAVKVRDEELRPLRVELREDLQEVRSQLSENVSEKTMGDTLQKFLRVQKAVSLRNERFNADVASFLTTAQRAKLLVWRSSSACDGASDVRSGGDDFQDSTPDEQLEPE